MGSEAWEELETLLSASPAWSAADVPASIDKVSVSPDFHKGAGVPIGTTFEVSGAVVPRLVGNDVACGMRFCTFSYADSGLPVTGLSAADKARLVVELRKTFFMGNAEARLSPDQRHRVLFEGAASLLEGDVGPLANREGAWAHLPSEGPFTSNRSTLGSPSSLSASLVDWVQGSAKKNKVFTADSSSGTVSGGNHFVELQQVAEVLHPGWAHGASVHKKQLCVMAHNGSLWFGHRAHMLGEDLGKQQWPPGYKAPPVSAFPLLLGSTEADSYMDYVRAAANFAEYNRVVLTLMTAKALSVVLGQHLAVNFVWDAAHNLQWEQGTVIHRKGATPAHGMSTAHPYGEPVVIPGAMGAASWVCLGQGNTEFLCSACHGAGRARRRGQAKTSGSELEKLLKDYPVVCPVDFATTRRDISSKLLSSIAQEAPWMYKHIQPAIDSLAASNIATPALKLDPVLTVKQL